MNPENIHSEDDFVKNQFEGFKVPPPDHVWQRVDQQMLDQELEQLCNSQFDDFEVSPQPEVWQKISKRLPLSLLLRRHLYQLSKVAAVLLLIMMIYSIWEQEAKPAIAAEMAEQLDHTEAATAPEKLIAEAPKEFVLDIEENPVDKNIGRRLLEKEEEELESIDDLWASIMNDADEFSEALNEEKLEDILKPLEKLPIEGLAMVPEKKKTVVTDESQDLTIMIPLKVVEEHEVEHLLSLYDQYKQNTKTVHKPSTD